MLDVPKLGAKAFQQAAGFLRVPESADPLDNSWVHPEHYDLVARMARAAGTSVAEVMAYPDRLSRLEAQAFLDDASGVGLLTVGGIVVAINARVRVKVLAVDAARNRISLSIKQAREHAG